MSIFLSLFQCNKISRENGAAHHLDKEARKWATKIAKENKSIREYQRALKLLGTGDKVNITSFMMQTGQQGMSWGIGNDPLHTGGKLDTSMILF